MIHVKPFGSDNLSGIIRWLNFITQDYLARIAVPFFFVTSGFFLYRKTSLYNFCIEPSAQYIKKLLRLYCIWTIIYFPLIISELNKGETGIVLDFLILIRSIIFTGSYLHLWYFPALIFAVFVISFLLKRHVDPKVILFFSGVLYFLGLFGQSWFGIIRPIKETFPQIWSLLKVLKSIIVTTRDGLFEAMFFVSIGMTIALFNINLKRIAAIIGFVISMALMLMEIYILNYYGLIREKNTYLFLGPVAFFMFCSALCIQLPNSEVFRSFRYLSSLIFFLHLLVKEIIAGAFRVINEPLIDTWLLFALTLAVTMLVSFSIIQISRIPKFKWIKFLYT